MINRTENFELIFRSAGYSAARSKLLRSTANLSF